MQQRGFTRWWPRSLGRRYTFRIDKAPANAEPGADAGARDGARCAELMYWRYGQCRARSRWAESGNQSHHRRKAQLARYAFDNHWWDLGVQATIAGKLWDHLEERFPLAYNVFSNLRSSKEISPKVTMAICLASGRVHGIRGSAPR